MGRPPKFEGKLPFPPYSGFESFLKDLGSMEVLPNRIDAGVFGPSYSGSGKIQILHAFRAFRLINGNGTADQPRLQPLLKDETRKSALIQLLKESYTGLFALPLASATTSQINDWFGQHGLDPHTARKARAFFLAAAKETGVPVHSTVLKKTRRGGKRKGSGKKGGQAPSAPPVVVDFGNVTTKRIEFKSGGWVSLSFAVDWSTLAKADREKLFEWLDAMTTYATPSAEPRTQPVNSHTDLPEYEFEDKDEEVPF